MVKKKEGSRKKLAYLEQLVANKTGRPSKYQPRLCDVVRELGAQGKSRTQIAACLGVARNTLANWTRQHPDFLTAIKEAKDLELAWWEELGQINLTRPGFNARAFIFQMKNRFPNDYGSARRAAARNAKARAPVLPTDSRQLADLFINLLAESLPLVPDEAKPITVRATALVGR